MFNFAAVLDRNAYRYADKIALSEGDRTLTYAPRPFDSHRHRHRIRIHRGSRWAGPVTPRVPLRARKG